jgi:hypothetical protein
MTDRTTIQIDTEQKEQLDEIKRIDGESYKSVIGLLIANYNNQQDATTNQAMAEIGAEEIAEQLRELESKQQNRESKPKVVERINELEKTLSRKIEALQR